MQFSRFRSTTFVESAADGGARELLRANVPIGPADWSRERISTAIDDGAEYMLRAQRPDGAFVYEYDPARGEDSTGDNIVRQLATAMDATAELSATPTGGTRFTLALHGSHNGNGTPS